MRRNTVLPLTASSRALRAGIVTDAGRLGEMHGFGSNPGALDARIYVPDGLPGGAALVVVLHGCTQSAAAYDKGSGWSQLADRHGFALLFPEQCRTNNANLCFNWFAPGDARRGQGEALSIAQMVENMAATHRIDRSRVFVTGLSAGGAMTSVMLTAYPELFAGGAIIAGLPYASANTLPEALEQMRGAGALQRGELASRAKAAADYSGQAPTLSVWHGTRDTTVNPANAVAIVDQWRDVYGLGAAGSVLETVNGHRREVWRDANGRDLIEKWDVDGMGHGTPLDTRGSEACGKAGPHMLEAGICSTRRIAGFWGLTGAGRVQREPPRVVVESPAVPTAVAVAPVSPMPSRASGVGAVIEDALRAAGLMR